MAVGSWGFGWPWVLLVVAAIGLGLMGFARHSILHLPLSLVTIKISRIDFLIAGVVVQPRCGSSNWFLDFWELDWFLDACWLWWQSRLVLGCGGGSQFWLWVWWLPVGYICGGCGWRERERERVVFYYIFHIILLGCM